ncbi:hypothetical protein RAS1_11930 [Phycisphaerae bacterium RAS1]|nr:hypothetical protein RAS1_11930 [Phycisphaerae bacterium RAS1]
MSRALIRALMVAAVAATLRAQGPASAPSSALTTGDEQRLADLLNVVEGPNSAEARRIGARELLRLGWPAGVSRLAGILGSGSGAARVAVAGALADLPEAFDERYVEPLVTMLSDADADVRQAGAGALAVSRSPHVIATLRRVLVEPAGPLAARLAATEALGSMTDRAAIAALAEALSDSQRPVATAAATAIEQATGMSFDGDPTSAGAWWVSVRDLADAEWQRQQIERLARDGLVTARECRALQARLVRALGETYARAADGDRPAMLDSFLADSVGAVRRLGLELIQAALGDGKPPSAEAAAAVRRLLADSDPTVRTAAIRTTANLRDAADAPRFAAMLAAEKNRAAREALVNGLGYVGGSAETDVLLQLAQVADDPCCVEAVASLGRLAERGALNEAARERVAAMLLSTFQHDGGRSAELRERLLWAMGLLADPRFESIFVATVEPREPTAIRVAAVRGLAGLKDARLLDVLATVTSDSDASIRRAAIDALARSGTSEAHLAALWGRLPAAQEADDANRETAWRGVLRILAGRTAPEIEDQIGRLPDGAKETPQRALDLLALLEKAYGENPSQRELLARTRERVAHIRASLGEIDAAVSAFIDALSDMLAAAPAKAPPIAIELLRFSVRSRAYSERVATAVATVNPSLDEAAVWNAIEVEIEAHLSAGGGERLIPTIEALRAAPPTPLSPESAARLNGWLKRARDSAPPATQPGAASQPASSPAAGPETHTAPDGGR